ncbi:MAG: tail fiber domain-containing protein [Clostridia bacterium]|nr:tail fiber domain-containing protein [Clostridia bacterium]
MYTQISEQFKNVVKSNVITATARLTFKNFFSDNSNLTLIKNDIGQNGLNLADYCYNNGQLVGTVMSKELEIEINNNNEYDLADKSFDLEIGVLIDKENLIYEFVPYGEYKVITYEDLKSSQKYRIVSNDLMINLNPEFKENTTFKPTFPIKLKEFYEQFMASYGIEVEEQTLPNEDFLIKVMPNFDGYTGRNILSKIAELFGSFAKINRNNKCQMFLKTETDEKIYKTQMNSKLEINKRYGPINKVTIGMSNVEGENVTLRNDQSIQENGETTIRIDDNPFLYTEKLREQVINDLYDRLNGFTYVPVSFQLKALMYSDCGDTIQVENMEGGTFVDTIILNQTIKIPATRQSTIESPALTSTAQKLEYISKSKQEKTKTEIQVLKHEQKINLLTSKTTEHEDKLAEIALDIDSISQKVENTIDATRTIAGLSKIKLEDCMEGELQELHIYGNNTIFNRLYPSDTLYPSNNLYPCGDSKIIVHSEDLKEKFETLIKNKTLGLGFDYDNSYKIISYNPYIKDNNTENRFYVLELEEGKTYNIILDKKEIGNDKWFYASTFEQNPIEKEGQTNAEKYYGNRRVYLNFNTWSWESYTNTDENFISITANEKEKYLVIMCKYASTFETAKIYENYKEIDLEIQSVLRQYEGIFDEYILEDNKAKVIRRIGVDSLGNLFIRENEIIEDLGELTINLNKGTNYIEISNYEANIEAKYVIINDFTKTFATTIELKSAIEQLANSINFQVTEVLKNKVGNDEVIAKINLAVENHQGIIRLISNILQIDSDNFKLSPNGTIEAVAGKIAGWNIVDYGLYKNKAGMISGNEEDGLAFYAGAETLNDLGNANFRVLNDGQVTLKILHVVAGATGINMYDNNTDVVSNYNQRGLRFLRLGQIIFELYTSEYQARMAVKEALVVATTDNNILLSLSKAGGYTNIPLSVNNEFSVSGNSNLIKNTGKLENKAIIQLTAHDTLVSVMQRDGTIRYVNLTSSDKRLKKNIKDTEIKSALELINKIRHKSFDWKKNNEHKKIGYIAQELEEIEPQFIHKVEQGENAEYKYLYQVDTMTILATATKAIQELSQENNQLKNKIDNLETRISKLEKLLNKEV